MRTVSARLVCASWMSLGSFCACTMFLLVGSDSDTPSSSSHYGTLIARTLHMCAIVMTASRIIAYVFLCPSFIGILYVTVAIL